MKNADIALGPAVRVILAASVFATASQARDLVLTRTARSGADSLIALERAWNKDCQQRMSSVTFTSQPTHGSVSVVQGVSTIPASTPRNGSTGNCAGQSIQGNEIRYLSKPGFHGTDQYPGP